MSDVLSKHDDVRVRVRVRVGVGVGVGVCVCVCVCVYTYRSVVDLSTSFQSVPSGKQTVYYGTSPFFLREDQPFQWPCSIAVCMFTRGLAILFNPMNDPTKPPEGTGGYLL